MSQGGNTRLSAHKGNIFQKGKVYAIGRLLVCRPLVESIRRCQLSELPRRPPTSSPSLACTTVKPEFIRYGWKISTGSLILFLCLIGCIVFFPRNSHAYHPWPTARRHYAAAQPELRRPAPAPPSPSSASRRTSSRHGHGRQAAMAQLTTTPPPKQPDTNRQPPSTARRPPGASLTSLRRQFLPRPPRHVWCGRRGVPACGAILGARAPFDSMPWRPGCHLQARLAHRGAAQHVARATGDRLPCLLPMQATAGRTPALLALTP